jgi:hypothetical protein
VPVRPHAQRPAHGRAPRTHVLDTASSPAHRVRSRAVNQCWASATS